MKLLYVIANPKKEGSTSMEVAQSYIDELKIKNPNIEVETLNLYDAAIGHVGADELNGASTEMKDRAIHFASFDYYVFAAPMWNLFFPSILKAYLDFILVKGVSFKYSKLGMPIGLLKDKKAVCVFARGGEYSLWPMTVFKHDKKYMKHILNFVGIKKHKFIEVDGVDKNPTKKRSIIEKAIKKAKKIAKSL